MKKSILCLLCLFSCVFGVDHHSDLPDQDSYVLYDHSFYHLAEIDHRLFILEEFLFFNLFSKVKTNANCTVLISPTERGIVHFEGTQQEIWLFIDRLLTTLNTKMDSEEIYEAKLDYIDALEKHGIFFEMDLDNDTEWEDFATTRNSIASFLSRLNMELRAEIRTMSGSESDLHRFSSLRLNIEDQKNIRKLIKKLADMNWLDLLLHKKEMEKLGEKIDPVHPMRFVAFIYSDPELRNKKLSKIRSDSLKWRSFIEGFNNRMALEHSHNNLQTYVPGFCYFTNNNPSTIHHYINNRDWTKVMESIIP